MSEMGAYLFRLCPSSSALLSIVFLPSQNCMIQLVQYYSAYRLCSPTCSAPNTDNTLLKTLINISRRGPRPALGLFHAALLCAAEQSSSGSSQARNRLCTSASREKERKRERNKPSQGVKDRVSWRAQSD